ncbi:DUF599 domain-containing protein [Undibacterium arcticum]|uniref:DUF599 domain-containing protein n=1 Tax=Undibacterium arcticum TaxID=1762892 RepID=A0ABV7F709_9BURK
MNFIEQNLDQVWQWASIAASLIAFGCYELYLRKAGSTAPMKTARSAHAAIRRQWIKSVMGRPGAEILVIQTLRNSVMAGSFMASTAVLALSGTLTLSGFGNAESRLWHLGTPLTPQDALAALKLLMLAASFFVSFLFAAMAVRFFNHAGYLITTEVPVVELPARQALAAAYLNRAGHYYSIGLRAFFACVPFLAGLFSTYLMLPVTVLLLVILHGFDRIPTATDLD